LLVEADTPTGFERGVRGLAIRVAKAVNRVLARHGRVWGVRYHARLLRTPREVRNALVYVLNNFRKHFHAARGLDPCSSATSALVRTRSCITCDARDRRQCSSIPLERSPL